MDDLRYQRFMAKVAVGEHWMWTASIRRDGYGQLNIGQNRIRAAHRLSYEHHVGPIPDGVFVCHHCDIKLCVRPDHLFLGTQTDNMRDARTKGLIPPRTSGRPIHTPEQVRAIRAAVGSCQEIADHFGTTRPTITRIRNRKVFRDI